MIALDARRVRREAWLKKNERLLRRNIGELRNWRDLVYRSSTGHIELAVLLDVRQKFRWGSELVPDDRMTGVFQVSILSSRKMLCNEMNH